MGPQCGFCQSSQSIPASALLAEIPKPTDEDIKAAMDGNHRCCASYALICRAIHRAFKNMES
ncbi:MAG: 2Fe-2S iron-sulfur cluster-binding protein [Rhodobacteraceae bacterium]|nr:2Fe-2S iron-sulfur cluster-binding protein [Paracoccaceae bacterium]